MKNCKKLYENQTASKLFSLPPTHSPPSPNKILQRLWNKTFLMETYRNIQTFAFKVPKNIVLGRQEMVQCFFWQKIQTCLLENL